MQITNIEVRSGRVVAHPFKQFSNIQSSIVLKANLKPNDAVGSVAADLTKQADHYVDQHIKQIIGELAEVKDPSLN